MKTNEIRKTFLGFFEERDHVVIPSASLIPDDPTLLFTSAGMVPFKPYFEGSKTPAMQRATSVQKCFRTTDLDAVGSDARHLSFFEMLGNFSFGDYFKREAIRWAWELVTGEFGLDPARLWSTVFVDDDEAADHWANESGIPDERILRTPEDFWDMGVAGPCGPCSHLYYDRGPKFGPEAVDGQFDEDRFFEIWNLVFIQNLRDSEGKVVGDLPNQNVDTGMGLERMATVLQEVDTVFDIDTIRAILATGEGLSGAKYGADAAKDVSLRVIAEHARGMTFSIADGVLPSNEHRGYVLRRLIRRSVLHGRKLGIEDPFLVEVAKSVLEVYGDDYPGLQGRWDLVSKVLSREESRFDHTLKLGLGMLEDELRSAKETGNGTLPGKVAFKLHDTYGFPFDLTEEIASDAGLSVDKADFETHMTAQRERARATRSFVGGEEEGADPTFSGLKETEFVGYESLSSEGQILKLASSEGAVDVIEEGEEGRLVVETTPFYAESGGQVGDRGEIRTPTGLFQVTDVQKGPSGLTVHHGRVVGGDVQKAQSASLRVDREHRVGVTQAHSGTHLLHWALRQVLGEHAHQQGSLVEPGRLRFDFSHYEAPSETEIAAIEEEINTKVLVDDSVLAFETSFDTAMEMGAMALFGEKYGDYVRVVQIGDFSRELCGGTHVRHTGQIGVLKITSEGSVAAGTRRVEVLTGMKGLLYLNQQEARLKELSALLKTDPDAAVERLERLQESMAEMERLINQQRRSRINKLGASLAEGDSLIETSGGKIATELLDETSVEDMREIANLARKKIGSGVVIIGSTNQGNANIVIAITQDLVDRGVSAKELIGDAAKLIGGGGGGQDGLAIAGGKSGSQLKAALELAQGTAKNALER